MLKPMLARGELHCIGATTLDEYRQYIEKDPALERRFQPVMVEEPTVEETISILQGLQPKLENFHKVEIMYNALESAAILSKRYISDRFLPDKAIDLVDEACAMVKTEMDTMPADMDELNRRINLLTGQIEGLKKDDDKLSKGRLEESEKELAELQAEFSVKKLSGIMKRHLRISFQNYVKKSTKLKMRKRLLIVIRISQNTVR